MSFPTSPTNGQIATLSNGITYSYTSATNYWARVPGAVSALPSFKNRLINGAMTFAQRSTGPISNTVASATLKYNTLDRWGYWAGANGYFYLEQSTTAPPGYNNSALITSGSATTVSSGVYATFSQRIEGYNILDLLWGTSTAQSVAVSFWINCSLTGTFSGYVFNSNYSYCYPFTFTIPTANTWVQITKLIPGPTSGTWNTTTGIGLEFGITLAAGSNFQDTANAWTTKSYAIGSAGSTNLLSTNGATMYVTGVQLEAGASATTFDYRDYGRELQMCQRYYETFYGVSGAYIIDVFQAISGSNVTGGGSYKVEKRASPSVSLVGTVYANGYNNGSAGAMTISSYGSGVDSWGTVLTGGSGLTAGNASGIYPADASSGFVFSAEL